MMTLVRRATADAASTRAAFTLIELIVVIAVLAILAGVAVVKYQDMAPSARRSADAGALAGINTALNQQYLSHRLNNASTGLITSPSQVAGVMHVDALPYGITIRGNQFIDQRGNAYDFIAETTTSPARLAVAASSAAAGSASGSGAAAASGSGSGSGGSSNANPSGGSAAMPEAVALLVALLPWSARPRRGAA